MRIHSITAHAFGPFVGQTVDFRPGMNLIYGPNEAGKSSWHAALYVGLCGIRRGRGRDEKGDVAFRKRHQPWMTPGWRVALTLSLEDGRRVEMDYDLDGKVASVVDVDLGRDYRSEIIYEGAPDGSRWLGLDRKAFLSTACVKQADLRAVLQDHELLQEHLQRAADTAGVDQTAARALEVLDTFQRERIGSTAINAKRPLRLAMNWVQDAERNLETARERHAAYERLAAQAEEAASQTEVVERRLRILEAKLAHRDAEAWKRRLSRAMELQGRYPEGAPPSAAGDDALAQQVSAAVAAWSERPVVPAVSGPSSQELRDQIEQLPAHPIDDTEVHPVVKVAVDHHREVAGAVERHLKNRPPEPETVLTGGVSEQELGELARDLEVVEPPVDPDAQEHVKRAQRELEALPARRGSLPWVVIGAILAVAGLLVSAGGLVPVGLALVLIGGAIALVSRPRANDAARLQKVLALRGAEEALGAQRHALEEVRRRRDEARNRAEKLGLEPMPPSLRALADQLAAANLARQRLWEWEDGREKLATELTEAQDQLLEALRARGADTTAGLDAAVAGYEAGCRVRNEQAAAAARRQDLEGQLEARKRLEDAACDAEQKVTQAAAALRVAAAACGVEGASEKTLVEGMKAWQMKRDQRLRALEAAREEWNELQGLLDGGTVEDLEREAGRRARVAADRSLGLEEDELSQVQLAEDVASQVDDLRRQAQDAARNRDQFRGRLISLAESAKGVPEAEEELAAAKEELRRLRELASVVELTTAFLQDAQERVHREIAPVLASTLKRWLPTVTGGRYQEVLVNPESLQVQVRPTGGTWRNAALLSHGTAEQVYLLLRVALAQHLTRRGEVCPLILDDVTVQSDARRTVAVLEILYQLSGERQIIFFSQEPEVLQWAQANLTDERDRVIELPEPSVPA